MAIDLCSENPSVSTSTSSTSMGMSPRISFSHDLSQSDISIPDEQRLLRSISASTVDFDFCIHHNFNHEPTTSAEELFSDGKILPTQLVKDKKFTPKSHEQKESPPTSPPLPLQPPPPPHDHHHGGGKCSENSDATTTKPVILSEPEPEDLKQKSKSFWQFKRSSSLNCGNGYARSLCPLPLLSRSNSTGSASTNSKKSSSSSSSSSRDALNHKQQQQKKTPLVAAPIKQSQFSSNGYQKPPLKKNGSGYGASHGNGVRINPVLNVPPANLFGLGSIFFSNNKDKNKKK